jgi:hypothetical protein
MFSAVSIANGPMDGIGSVATDEAKMDARGSSLLVRSSRNSTKSS